jgi:hypothetical protein
MEFGSIFSLPEIICVDNILIFTKYIATITFEKADSYRNNYRDKCLIIKLCDLAKSDPIYVYERTKTYEMLQKIYLNYAG